MARVDVLGIHVSVTDMDDTVETFASSYDTYRPARVLVMSHSAPYDAVE